MDESKKYNVSAKRQDTGKFWGFGRLEHNNQYNNWRIGMKVTPELKALINANDGKYINFSLFEIEEKREVPPEAAEGIKRLEQAAFDDSDIIPF